MRFDTFLGKTVSEIDTNLEKLLEEFLKKHDNSPRIQMLLHVFADANRNGKRIRGTLIVLGYELSGKKATQEISRLAALYELIQTSLLIHDDVIDRSEKRRGKESVYKRLGKNHYAISQSISLGDLGYFFAEEEIAASGFTDEIKTKLLTKLNHILSHTAKGQMLDVSFEEEQMIREEEIFQMMEYKTANYTFIGPLQLGMIASREFENLTRVENFGKHLGIAFQLQDDLLGVFGSEKDIGKSNTSDIIEGKKTILFAYAFSRADTKQTEFLGRAYGNPRASKEDIKKIRLLFEETGARTDVERLSEKHFQKAFESVDEVAKTEDGKKILVSLVDFITQRTN